MKLGKTFRAFSNQRNPSQWLIEAFGGKPSKTGVKVTVETSLGLAPVMYAVNKISGHIAQMPIDICKFNEDGTKPRVRNNTYKLLNKNPNDIMTAFQLKEMMQVHALIAGNGRAYIERNSNGTPTGLIPILPYNCQTMLVDGQKWHLVTQDAGTTQDAIPRSLKNGEYYKIPDRDVLHVMNTSYNGVWGMHIIDIAKGKRDKSIDAQSHIIGSIAAEDGRAYVGHHDCAFLCIDLKSEKVVWQYKDRLFPYSSSPALTKDRVLFGGEDKRLHCVRRDNGKAVWTFNTRGQVNSSPVVCGGKVIVGSNDGRLYIVRLKDGKLLSSFETEDSITASPAVVDGKIIIGSEDGTLYCLGTKKK